MRAAAKKKSGGGSSQDVGAGTDADTPAEPAGVQDVDMPDAGGAEGEEDEGESMVIDAGGGDGEEDEGESMVIDAGKAVAELLEEGPEEQCARMRILLFGTPYE